jgi:DNA mismatch endonuclease (patch repair protein)
MDKFPKETRSKIMSKIHSKHTTPEIVVRRLLSKIGVKYKLHYGNPTIDIAIPSKKIALFVDGCFWHNCPRHGHKPKSNRAFWNRKLKRNATRDKRVNKEVRAKGWKVVHIWEHETFNRNRLSAKLSRIIR